MSLSSLYFKKNRPKEMDFIIKKSLQKGHNFLWQNIDGKKKIFDVKAIETNASINVLFLQLNQKCKVDQVQPIFVKLSYLDAVFKTHFLASTDNFVSVSYPKEFLAKEMRGETRYKFNFSQKNTVKIVYEIDFMKGATQTQSFQLKDVSLGGFSCLCSVADATGIDRFKNFKIKIIGQKFLGKEIEIDFVYAKKVKVKINKKTIIMYRLGFKFKEKLKAQTLKELFSTSFQVI